MQLVGILVTMGGKDFQKAFISIFLASHTAAFDNTVRIQYEHIAGLEPDGFLCQAAPEQITSIQPQAKTG